MVVFGSEVDLLNSKALTKTQSIILIAVIVIAAVGGGAYILLNQQEQTSETIKIGILADLDASGGKKVWKAAVLAAEQLNAEGGILGKQVELIGEDSDSTTSWDASHISLTITRLITHHK